MVTNCVVNGCHNTSDINRTSFHVFPFNRPDILQLWISATGRQNWYPSKSSKVCGEHFLPSDYQLLQGYTKKRLKIDAVPSVFNEKHPINATARHIKTEETDEPMYVNLNISGVNSQSTSTARLNTLGVGEDSNINPVIDLPSTSTKPKTFVDCASQTAENYRSSTFLKRKLKTLQQKIKRKDIRISNLKEMINEIKKNGHSNEKAEVLKIYIEGRNRGTSFNTENIPCRPYLRH